MKRLTGVLFAVVLIEILCVICASTLHAQSSEQEAASQFVSTLLKEAEVQDKVLQTHRSSSDRMAKLHALLNRAHAPTAQDTRAAVAQVFVRLLEGKVRTQDLSAEERAKMASLLSKIKEKFSSFGNKLKGGFKSFEKKVKNFFHGKR